jgi:F-type H+-transporting ATPase subunit b
MDARGLARIGAGAALVALPRAAAAAEGSLEVFPDWTGLLPLLVALFVVIIFPADRLLLRPLLRVLDERHERIEGARGRADALSGEADEVLARYEAAVGEARDRAEAGRREALDRARREQTGLTSQARTDAETEIARARDAVGRALGEARAALRADAELLAREAASQVLGRRVA